MKKCIRGFSLIELMVVVAILGILSAVAVPLYADHITRSQLGRAYSEVANYSRAIEPLVAEGKGGTVADNPTGTVGFVDSTLTTVAFGSFADPASSTITATMDGASGSALQGVVMQLQRSGTGTWTCTVGDGDEGIKDRLRPTQCR